MAGYRNEGSTSPTGGTSASRQSSPLAMPARRPSRAACSWPDTGRDIWSTRACRGFVSFPRPSRGRIGCSRISSRWVDDARSAPRRARRGRAARRPRLSHLAGCLSVRLRVVRPRDRAPHCVHDRLLVNVADWAVLLGTLVGIAAYGVWRTRHVRSLTTYLRGDAAIGWGTIGLSVMATQASAVTFLSIPGQGFDDKTRLLGAGLFLVQRGLAAGVTIYAPAIIISTVLGWRVDLVVVFTGLLVLAYTVAGGSEAVALTHRWQVAVIWAGMATAVIVLLLRLPPDLGLNGAAHVAGALGKLRAVDFSLDPSRRYTVWTGVFGGLFLSLSYFGTDQSQVQRYIAGPSLRNSRLGLMFNAVLKIPMQFVILVLGAFLFVFYQFVPPPVFFNQAEWRRYAEDGRFRAIEAEYAGA